MRILVIEDNASLCRLLKRALSGAGHRVVTAADGEEGLACYRQSPETFDLVILDMVLPRLDGSEVYAAIREQDSDCPVILTSGYFTGEMPADIADNPRTRFLAKPFPLADLLALVDEFANELS